MLREVRLLAGTMNQVAASITARVTMNSTGAKLPSALVSAGVYEVGFDGSKPTSPLAAVAPVSVVLHPDQEILLDLPLRIGTPFYWTEESQPRYAVIISVAQTGQPLEQGEVQFGFDSNHEIVVTEPLRRVCIAPPALNPNLPSLFVISDSTAFSNGRNQRGWGDELGNCFDPGRINVLNRARPGRSTRSFRNEGLWSRVLAEIKSGDWVLIQFGHNDADKLDEGRCRGVLPGIGEETQEIVLPDGTRETVHTYGWYLRQFIAEAKARGARPVLLSLTAKNLWAGGRLVRRQSDYGGWAAAVAAADGVPFIDLTEIIADRCDALGREGVQALFCSANDNVHTSPAGARLNAECVTIGLKKLNLLPV